MEIKERIAIIPCAGISERMGEIQVPKCLYEIMGKPSLVHLLDQLKNTFSTFYIPISDSNKEINIYKKLIPDEYLENIVFVPSKSGSGDGQAVLDALDIFKDKHTDNYLMICWGDIFIKDVSIINSFLREIETGYSEPLVIPTKEVENPYFTYFLNRNRILKRVAFQRRGQFFDKGLTDLSFFFIKPKSMVLYLNAMRKDQVKENKTEDNSLYLELNFLDIVEYLSGKGNPAVSFIVADTNDISSFNTVKEAEEITNYLIKNSKENVD